MPVNIFMPSFKKAPKGFLILAFLVLFTEMTLAFFRPHLVSGFWAKFTINESFLLNMEKDFNYLIIGDSIQKTGIEVRNISEDILNLGLPGAKPPASYTLLERYLRNNKAPDIIFLFVDPQNVYGAEIAILKYFVSWREFMSLWPYLSGDEKRHFFLRHWVSYDERRHMGISRQVYKGSNNLFVNEMKENHGFMPLPEDEDHIPVDFFSITGARPEKRISIEKRDFIFLEKFVHLARENNIKIVMLGNVVPEELYHINNETGYSAQWLTFLEIVRRAYPDIVTVEEEILYFPNRYFADEAHFNKKGRNAYTEYFRDKVFHRYTRKRGEYGKDM